MKNTIKILGLIALLAIIGFTMVSCGESDGDVYLKYTWVYTPSYFTDTNPAIPSTFYNGTYYKTKPGVTYTMSYRSSGGSGTLYTYTYNLKARKGGDIFYEIYLSVSGASITSSNSRTIQETESSAEILQNQK